jgi:hypothetical protein
VTNQPIFAFRNIMRAVSFALFAAVFFALAVGAAEMKWQKYTNGRFGFT